jgi:hypothetical protein
MWVVKNLGEAIDDWANTQAMDEWIFAEGPRRAAERAGELAGALEALSKDDWARGETFRKDELPRVSLVKHLPYPTFVFKFDNNGQGYLVMRDDG